MTRKLTLLIAAAASLAIALIAAGLSTSSASGSPAAAGATVDLAKSRLGRMLVDARGRTLYLFEKDRGRASTCYSACASFWPPVTTTGKPQAGRGVHAALLGTTKRKDGKTEVTYAGHPLYYFAGDLKRGDVNGQGLHQFGAGWDVVSATGKKIERRGS
jgi:predicted lipoprotein with Yx(FWY)xxD motif